MSAPGLFDGARLKAAIKDRKVKIVDLAEEIGRSREAIFGWMDNRSTPNSDDLAAMCLALCSGRPRAAGRMMAQIMALHPTAKEKRQ
jgi:hypothetical protein